MTERAPDTGPARTRRPARTPPPRTPRRRARALAAAVVASVAAAAGADAPATSAAPIWRLEQPPPPAGAPFNVPLGTPGDLKFWAPNRGLLAIAGNETIPRGLYRYDGSGWRPLATVCGGPGDSARIAWAGPREFWVVSEPSRPRAGAGLALCRFKDGQVVGSWSTPVEAADPFRQLLAAACAGPSNCWFGGIAAQDPLGTRVGAFHLRWDGTDLTSHYAPQDRAVSDIEVHAGAFHATALAGRRPEDRDQAASPAEPEPVPRLLRRIAGGAFPTDPFEPAPQDGVPVDGSELLALDSNGAQLWAVGGAAASGLAARDAPGGVVARPPLAARLVGDSFEEVELTGAAFGPTDRLADVAAIPASSAALAAVVPFTERASVNSKATVARIEADGSTTLTRLPAAGAGRGSAARVACPGPADCWLVTRAGWVFHYSEGGELPRDTDPAFQTLIDFRPNEAAAQFIPDRPPVDDSQLFAPPPLELDPLPSIDDGEVRRLPPLLGRVRTRLRGMRLVVAFTVRRRARVQLIAKRGRRTVGRTPRRLFAPGRRQLALRLRRDRYPTRLAFRVTAAPRAAGSLAEASNRTRTIADGAGRSEGRRR